MQALTQSIVVNDSAPPREDGGPSAAGKWLSLMADRWQPLCASIVAACSSCCPQPDVRRPARSALAAHVDPSTSLYNEAGLVHVGAGLLARARRERRHLALAVFDCADLLEVRSIYGSSTARKLLKVLVRSLCTIAGSRGLVARTGPAQFAVLMPAEARDKALAAIHKVLGSPMRIEFEAGEDEIVLVPEVAVDRIRAQPRSIETVLDVLRSSLRDAWACEERRRVYLRRERERHSQPMGLDASATSGMQGRAALGASRAMAATIPARLEAC